MYALFFSPGVLHQSKRYALRDIAYSWWSASGVGQDNFEKYSRITHRIEAEVVVDADYIGADSSTGAGNVRV
jgi:hypothetical protein